MFTSKLFQRPGLLYVHFIEEFQKGNFITYNYNDQKQRILGGNFRQY